MKSTSHLKVASKTLAEIESKLTWKINRKAYLFGSVAPDFNCAFPCHTLNNTLDRFSNRLKRIDNSHSNIVKSFTLGVITHYICDYFCYAHTMDLYGIKHWWYEGTMKKHLKTHLNSIDTLSQKLVEVYSEVEQEVLENELKGVRMKHSLDQNIHVNYILEVLTGMHKDYLSTIDRNIDKRWFKSLKQIDEDIQYATFMCQRIASLILDSSLENVGVGLV